MTQAASTGLHKHPLALSDSAKVSAASAVLASVVVVPQAPRKLARVASLVASIGGAEEDDRDRNARSIHEGQILFSLSGDIKLSPAFPPFTRLP